MKIAVLGSGVVGVTTAWWLRQAGHDVVVIDRHTGPGLDCSRAGGGQLSLSYAEPWATRHAPLQLLKWLFTDDAPLRFRPRADARQWAWNLQFFRECWPGRLERNVRSMVALSAYSLDVLRQMRTDLGIDDQHQQRGILNIYRDEMALEQSQDMAEIMRKLGVERRILNANELVELEPALAPSIHRLAGGDYAADDETANAWLFTQALSEHARHAGVEFLFSREVSRLVARDGRVIAAELIDLDGSYEELGADAFVVSMGAHSPDVLMPLRIPCNVYPTKGYSATFDIVDPAAAPQISLTDSANKLVYSRMGNTLRIAGLADLSGFSRGLDPDRCRFLARQARALFSGALDFEHIRFWSGLRPSTPSGVPLVGRTRIANLYLNTGHGTLGWTMAAGSGRALADLISGREPEPEFPFIG